MMCNDSKGMDMLLSSAVQIIFGTSAMVFKSCQLMRCILWCLGWSAWICVDQSYCDVGDPGDIKRKCNRIRMRYRAAPTGQAREPGRWCDRAP